ncbi:MAG TPA: PepSY-associated TM helix domain-containing protein [Pseudomonadales bacterium]|nr:PepSY-associated TM helix domain-containing protein [Pseudomonadales bacterium]
MRQSLVLLHRWFGLLTAVFLFIAGFTGAIISWDHELDEWLNPELFHSAAEGNPQNTLILANQLEASDPRLLVSYLPLQTEMGRALTVSVDARIDPVTKKIFDVGFNQIALSPVSGEVQGRREWGAVSLSRENLLPFLYKLHYSMHIPEGFNIELGVLFMGIVGIVWVIDCFIALWISFPRRRSWRKSFVFRWHKSPQVINFDLHRSGGVWVWVLLLILAVTSVSMNLGYQVTRPLVALVSDLVPSPFEGRELHQETDPLMPGLSREKILVKAKMEAAKRGWSTPVGAIFYSVEAGLYGVSFFEPGHDHGDGGLGNPMLYFDGLTGQLTGANVPGEGSAGDIFLQAQFPLHSGRILGLPGRIFVSLMGLAVAMLSVTGIVIWLRKRSFRR